MSDMIHAIHEQSSEIWPGLDDSPFHTQGVTSFVFHRTFQQAY